MPNMWYRHVVQTCCTDMWYRHVAVMSPFEPPQTGIDKPSQELADAFDGIQTHPSSEMSAEERDCRAAEGLLDLFEALQMLLLRCMYRGPGGSCRGWAWG